MSPLRLSPSGPSFLADTWWYGMTRRWDRDSFRSLAERRSNQGFDAIQLVVGIPPEVGPEHAEAASEVGPAWELSGRINRRYLELARDRIEILFSVGLRPIVYAAWGPQIDWLGAATMQRWWSAVMQELADLDPIYCLCGEVDLHCDVNALRTQRLARWRAVLEFAHGEAAARFLVHTTGSTTAFDLFGNHPSLLANSTQTGHARASTPLLYERPLEHRRRFPGRAFVNLEPWYEGIRGSFGTDDQLFAFWASKLAGSTGHAYGAQGLWNLGDGRFLSHWGEQTLNQATALDTPEHLGRLYRWWLDDRFDEMTPFVRRSPRGRVLGVGRSSVGRSIELRFAAEDDTDEESVLRLDLFGQARALSEPPFLVLRGFDRG